MANGEPEVKDVERVEVVPTTDTELVDAGATAPDSSQANEGAAEGAEEDTEKDPADASEDGKPDALVRPPATEPAATDPAPPAEGTGIAAGTDTADTTVRLPGETPKEYALRLETQRLRGELRKVRTDELIPPTPASTAGRRNLTDAEKATLGKYPAEQLAALREVMPALAKEMGFVKAEELEGDAYQERAQGELDGFLEKHPEYLPKKDPDGTLWGALKSEFGLYKAPQNPKDYRKLLERAHQTVFGIKPSGALPNNAAATRKIQVASAGGTAGPGPSGASAGRNAATAADQGYRFDMLKGFSDTEMADLKGKTGA